MTTLHTKLCKCGNCGASIYIRTVTSTNAMGYPDLDLRPPQMQRSTMPHWVQECPECNYVSKDIEKRSTPYKKLLASDAYKTCDGNNFENTLTRKFYRMGLISLSKNKFAEAYASFLHAAWASDDSRDDEAAKVCRMQALATYEKLPDKDDKNRMVQRADLLRRVGEFDKLTEEYADAVYDETVLQDIIAFQLALAKERNTDCYTLAAVYGKI